MIRPVIQAPDARLLQPSAPVVERGTSLGDLLGDLHDTRMRYYAAGLAAVQIGVHLRVIALQPDKFYGYRFMINPEVLESAGDIESIEGCISVGYGEPRFKVRRPTRLIVAFKDRYGQGRQIKAEGFAAALIAHEIDHLDGRLIA